MGREEKRGGEEGTFESQREPGTLTDSSVIFPEKRPAAVGLRGTKESQHQSQLQSPMSNHALPL